MGKPLTYVDQDGDKIHVLDYRGAKIRVRTHKTEMSGTKRYCELIMPDGKEALVLCTNNDPDSLQAYESVATIISDCKYRVREWHKKENQDEQRKLR